MEGGQAVVPASTSSVLAAHHLLPIELSIARLDFRFVLFPIAQETVRFSEDPLGTSGKGQHSFTINYQLSFFANEYRGSSFTRS